MSLAKIAGGIPVCGKSGIEDLVSEADILVAGKGMAGLSAAFFAAERYWNSRHRRNVRMQIYVRTS